MLRQSFMNAFTISQTTPAAAALTDLLDICFGPGRLARTAERLREHNRRIAAYDFAAYEGDRLVGAISFWPLMIGDDPALLLGPLAVHPDMQGKGLGLALMQEALQHIDAARFSGILLVGDLPYYTRAGFAVAPSGLSMPGPVDPARLLLRPTDSRHAAHCSRLSGLVRPAPELC